MTPVKLQLWIDRTPNGASTHATAGGRVWREAPMSIKEEFRDARQKFRLLSLYQRFEHVIVMFLTALIAVIVIAAVWNLSLKILFGLVLSGSLDPSDYTVFQAVFGMILTVIIARIQEIASGGGRAP